MLRVLLVEDNPADVYLVRRAFENARTSLELLVATDGNEAQRMITDRKPDLVILDLGIPKHDGFEILAECRSARQATIVFTGSENPTDRERAIALGARDYIVKSTHLDEFEESIHSALARSMPPPGETTNKNLDRQEILHTLKSELAAARHKANEATKRFDEVIRETHGGLPHPNGVQRIHNASREVSSTREELVEAHVRLNAFVAQGIIPDHLKNSVGRSERSAEGKRRSGES